MLQLYFGLLLATGCQSDTIVNPASAGREPAIEPDYSGVTIPRNIAPMNFYILEKGTKFRISVTSLNGSNLIINSTDGVVSFPLKEWKRLLAGIKGGKIEIEITASDKGRNATKFDPIKMYVSSETIDPFLCYRLLYPGYRSWVEMKIVQRSLEDFNEYSLFENQLLDDNCVNCHSFRQNNPDRFLIHVRGSKGGTYFYDGKKLTRTSLKTKEMQANTVYPAWNPAGRYVAFSSNKTVQSFHMRPEKNIEVYDLFSSLVIYDTERNEMFPCNDKDTIKYMETFPCWSADGNYLYYCRAPQVSKDSDITKVRYDLVRKSFDKVSGLFGNTETVFDAISKEKSVSLPAVSPDGKYLIFVLHDYGTFSIWHREADLYILDLQNGKAERMRLNSDETESYHSWSSNGKWIVFSSKRGDGLTARPYISYFESPENTGKPFVLPQKDPSLYLRLEKTFNRPEFVTGKIPVGPRDFEEVSEDTPLKPSWVEKVKN